MRINNNILLKNSDKKITITELNQRIQVEVAKKIYDEINSFQIEWSYLKTFWGLIKQTNEFEGLYSYNNSAKMITIHTLITRYNKDLANAIQVAKKDNFATLRFKYKSDVFYPRISLCNDSSKFIILQGTILSSK